jgi:hypothetical protein
MVSQSKCSDATAREVRKVRTIEQKINMFYELECGDNIASVGRYFDISESSVRTHSLMELSPS